MVRSKIQFVLAWNNLEIFCLILGNCVFFNFFGNCNVIYRVFPDSIALSIIPKTISNYIPLTATNLIGRPQGSIDS